MAGKAIIYGKSTCPFTKAAIDDYTDKGIYFDYIDIVEKPDQLEMMLKYSKGERKIPVIVNGDTVSTGFNGKC